MRECSDDVDLTHKLEKEYCPPIDSALLAAIILDYDLNNPDEVERLRETLDSLKDSALQEECMAFDPSGTANDFTDAFEAGATSSTLLSNAGQDTLPTHTDSTSQESDHSPTVTHSTYIIAADGSVQFVGASEEEKVTLLLGMFPDISKFDVEQSLKKSNGDIEKSMDILLNLSFFDTGLLDEDKVIIPKGLDGFGDEIPDIGRHKGRKNKRNKWNKVSLESSMAAEDDPPPTNQWEKSKTDIDFISSRTPSLPRSKVASVYTLNSRSLSATIKALANAHAPKDGEQIENDPVAQSQLDELLGDYPKVPRATLVGLLRITRNMISAANELAGEMIRKPVTTSVSDLIKITAPKLNLDDETDVVDTPRHLNTKILHSTRNYESEQAAANSYFAAKSIANAQAAKAARKAKSDPLYGGASHYYREVAQQNRELAMQHLSAASERLVDRQSTNGDVDLHGCQVPQAIRIARERVEAWWDGLGDTKYVRGGGKHAHNGFKIITGVGHHSRDGKARLGPAVTKALVSDGWRVEVGRGFLTVYGVNRR